MLIYQRDLIYVDNITKTLIMFGFGRKSQHYQRRLYGTWQPKTLMFCYGTRSQHYYGHHTFVMAEGHNIII